MTTLLFAFAVICANLDPVESPCLTRMAARFALPEALLVAIREQEAGRVGTWHANADGSIDYGVMQINSRWLPALAPQGYTAAVLTYDACASIAVGAWILAQALADAGVWHASTPDPTVYWRSVGRYHSRTPKLNRGYAQSVWARYRTLSAPCPLPPETHRSRSTIPAGEMPATPRMPRMPRLPSMPAATALPLMAQPHSSSSAFMPCAVPLTNGRRERSPSFGGLIRDNTTAQAVDSSVAGAPADCEAID